MPRASSPKAPGIGKYLASRAAENKKSDTPFLDACLIAAFCMGISRDRLLACLGDSAESIPPEFKPAWERRLLGESVASIIGKKEFYGRDFFVDRRVLIPRPDTELLVSAALELGDSRATRIGGDMGTLEFTVIDACTGSGAVAISLAAERPAWRLCATDISAEALEVARINSRQILGRILPAAQADLLEIDANFSD
ncbi:MAG: methyltransferase, partial [Spirochaetia bacterium]|nr:methyltransferase [Spirochaetia bacterium]